jgi:protein-L-isoaspartate(D-aspartate) O-methyltransferase
LLVYLDPLGYNEAQMEQAEKTSPLDQMIRREVVDRGISDPRVIAAMRATPRDLFFSASATEQRASAFAGRAMPIGHGQTISEPYIVALMSERLAVLPEHKVLEIGTGSGYQTAVLCRLGREVYSIERIKPLLDSAFERLMEQGIRNVHFRHGDGTLGWPERAPFDRIVIAAGAPEVPKQLLLSQLADGGIAVLPHGPMERQMLSSFTRHGRKLVEAEICPVRFVKLIGAEGWSAQADLQPEASADPEADE